MVVEELDDLNNVIQVHSPASDFSPYVDKNQKDWVDFNIPMRSTGRIRFRIKAQVLITRIMRGEDDYKNFYNEPVFTAFAVFPQDFQLDYIPVTILYCPPEQDMINAIDQTAIYRTVATMGAATDFGKTHSGSTSIGGGVVVGGLPKFPD